MVRRLAPWLCIAALAACSDPASSQDAGADAARPPDAASPYPDTPVGKQLAWFVGAINAAAESGAFPEAEFDAHFADAYKAKQDFAWFNTTWAKVLMRYYAPLEVKGWETSATDHAIWARLACKDDRWEHLYIAVEEQEPNPIARVMMVSGPDLDPAFGPIGASQVGFFPYDPSRGKTAGKTFELVDRATGKPFSPAVTGEVDQKYGYVRLAIPDGQTEAGLKITHSDGQVTYTYSALLRPGTDLLGAPAYSSAAFTDYATRVDLTLAKGKAQVWGLLAYEGVGDVLSIDAGKVSSGVGCATVTGKPALANLFYTVAPKYLPDKAAKSTPPENSTFYALNLDPVAHSFTAQATGAPRTVSVPPLVADAITVVILDFDPATYPSNPTVAGCK